MPDGDPVRVSDGDAPLAVRAFGGGGGEVAGQRGVERAEAVAGAGPLGQAEQGHQRDGEVRPRGQRREKRCRSAWPLLAGTPAIVASGAIVALVAAAAVRAITAGAVTAGTVVGPRAVRASGRGPGPGDPGGEADAVQAGSGRLGRGCRLLPVGYRD